jgi:hypothetical protein
LFARNSAFADFSSTIGLTNTLVPSAFSYSPPTPATGKLYPVDGASCLPKSVGLTFAMVLDFTSASILFISSKAFLLNLFVVFLTS